MKKISVIIPAFNEEEVINDCLESLVNQTFQNFNAMIVDDCSTDRTAEIIQSYQNKFPSLISCLQFGKVGPGKARNLAAKKSTAEWLAFMDADCIATPDWLNKLSQSFDAEGVASVGGPHLAPNQSNSFQVRVESFFRKASCLIDFYKTTPEVKEVSHNPLCNVAYRRDVFEKIGGFREDLFPGEDVAIDQAVRSLGWKILYRPDAVVYHHRPETIRQFRKVMKAYGRAQGKLTRESGPRRLIQWLGLSTLVSWPTLIWIGFQQSMISGIFVVFALLIFYGGRPNSDGYFSIILNSLQWFNGFIEGLITNESLPPGATTKLL